MIAVSKDARSTFHNTCLESPSESFAAANVLRYSSTFLVDIVSFSISLSTNAGEGPGERSLPSTMRLSLGLKGLPVNFNILSVLILPRQKGRSPILLCCIEKTRNAFICSISSGTSPILFLLRSSISNSGRPKIFLSVSSCFDRSDPLSTYGLRHLSKSVVAQIEISQGRATNKFVRDMG